MDETVEIDVRGDYEQDEWYSKWYKCPRCGKGWIAKVLSYCPNCGVKIVWSASVPEDDERHVL